MSVSLYWQPNVPPKGQHIGPTLRIILTKRFGYDRFVLDDRHLDFLAGVKAAHADGSDIAKDVDALTEAIEKYGSLELWTE